MDGLDLLECAARQNDHGPHGLHGALAPRAAAHLAATKATGVPVGSPPLSSLGPAPELWIDTAACLAPASIETYEWRVRSVVAQTFYYTRATLAAVCNDASLWAPIRHAWRGTWPADEGVAVCIAVAQYASGPLLPVEVMLVRQRSAPLGVRWAGIPGSEVGAADIADMYELHPMYASPRSPPASLEAALESVRDDAARTMHVTRLLLVAPDAGAACFFLWRLSRAGERFACAATVRALACRATQQASEKANEKATEKASERQAKRQAKRQTKRRISELSELSQRHRSGEKMYLAA